MAATALVSPSGGLVIRVRDLGKRYGREQAVRGISFEVRPGEMYGLIGPDGAGKSTLMKAVAGVLTFDAGSVEVFGTRVDSERSAERIKARVGYLPQGLGLNLYPELSIEENVDFFARLRGVPPGELTQRKQRLLALTRLAEFRKRPMKQLSGGMKQKLGLVCTLVHEPDLLILDEPTTGVDPVSRRDFWTILNELMHERPVTALVSTAYLDEASRFDRVSLVLSGSEIAAGTPETLAARAPGSVVGVQLGEPFELEGLRRLRNRFPQIETLGSWLKVFVERATPSRARELVRETLDELQPRAMYTSEPELEDIFVALLREQHATVPSPARRRAACSTTGQRGRSVAIQARELTRDFGAFRAVDRVSFEVAQGEIFGLLGANGAGKTTVIKMLTGIVRPSAGTGQVAGADVRRAAISIKRRIGYVSQAFSLYADLTVAENIALYAGIYGLSPKEARQRAGWIYEMASLSDYVTQPAGSLPMGMRQRLALGCALLHRPQVLFLDEPTSGVDPLGRRSLWEILYRLSREEDVAILVTTHYMSEAEHCDRLALMFAGRIVADAPPAVLKADVARDSGELLELSTDCPDAALSRLRAAGYEGASLFGRRIHVFSKQAPADAATMRELLAANGMRVQAIEPRPLSLEDVFVFRVSALERAREPRAGAP